MMHRNVLAAGFLSCVLAGVGSVTAIATPAGNGDHYTQSQLKRMAAEAKTPEQFQVLASYYSTQQQHFAQLAADEKAEWARRSQFTQSIEAKYPRPVDSARNLYEYYAYRAAEAATLSEKYAGMATAKQP